VQHCTTKRTLAVIKQQDVTLRAPSIVLLRFLSYFSCTIFVRYEDMHAKEKVDAQKVRAKAYVVLVRIHAEDDDESYSN